MYVCIYIYIIIYIYIYIYAHTRTYVFCSTVYSQPASPRSTKPERGKREPESLRGRGRGRWGPRVRRRLPAFHGDVHASSSPEELVSYIKLILL